MFHTHKQHTSPDAQQAKAGREVGGRGGPGEALGQLKRPTFMSALASVADEARPSNLGTSSAAPPSLAAFSRLSKYANEKGGGQKAVRRRATPRL